MQRVCDKCFYLLHDYQPELRQSFSRANQETPPDEGTPLPHTPSVIDFHLEKEIQKATAIVHGFKSTVDGEGIPRHMLAMAKGVVFFTIAKLGFVFTGRYGTGLIIAKLPDGRWSAPSAVQMTGVGWGLQVGAELTTVMLILATESAVNAFKSLAQISVGAELGVSVGPIGRSLETDVSAGQEGAAHAFSYAQSKGLFVGASLEASGIAARPDVNRTFYGEKVSISALLQGDYPRPRGAQVLYEALNDVLYGGPPTPPARPPRGMSSMVENASPVEHLDSQNSSTSSTGSAGNAPLKGTTGLPRATAVPANTLPRRGSGGAQGANIYAAVEASPSAPSEGEAVDVML